MLSDDSSSDSETGRFKCSSQKTKEQIRSPKEKESQRHRNSSSSHSYQSRNDRHRERSRYSPRKKRRYSREKSSTRNRFHSRESSKKSRDKTPNRHRHHHSSGKSHRNSKSRSFKSPEVRPKDKIKSDAIKEKSPLLSHVSSNSESENSTNNKIKKSEVHVPTVKQTQRKITEEPVCIENNERDYSDELQPQSYYNMIPATLKENSTETSEIDSSDDEKLRAKLLSLEKEVRKRKHKKKRKKKSSKHREKEEVVVEVSSTTDIKENITIEESLKKEIVENMEVTSTQKSVHKESSEEGEISDDSNIEIDPSDLRHKLSRSVTKPNLKNPEETCRHEDTKSKLEVCGPALPPHLEKRFRSSKSPEFSNKANVTPSQLGRDKTIGPTICPDMRQMLAQSNPKQETYEISDEDEGIGPLPKGSEDNWSAAHQHLEERALDLKIKQLDGQPIGNTDVKTREEWMLELPEAKAKYLGLEARTFRAKEGPDMSDRSSWTDTPQEKVKKTEGQLTEKDAKKTFESNVKAYQIALHDSEQEKAIKKHKKKHKRDESLFEIHQKKLKKKKKKDDKNEKPERKPFSRETDLQANRFDEAQKRSIINKAQDLNSRFSRGEAKYL